MRRPSFADETVSLPAIVWAELLIGVRLARDPGIAARGRAKLEQICPHVPLVDFTPDIAEHYVDIFRECSQQGTILPQNDMAVAATARFLDSKVVVGPKNEKHFRYVKGLEIVVLGA